jgi:SAM-dependent methyltransferase
LRVLVTGLSPMQCNRGNRLKYSSVIDLYVACLRWAGHEVDHREWTPGEDLSVYDVAIVGQIPWNSINARHVYTVCDVIGRARASGTGLVFAIDDWQFRQIHQSVRSLNKNSDRLFTSVKGRTNREWAEGEGRPMVDAVLNAMATRPWPTTLVPAFEWGDHQLLKPDGIPSSKIVYMDPTVFQQYACDRATPDERVSRWVLGTLSNQLPWVEKLGIEWPVEYFGTAPSKAKQRLKEGDLVQVIAQSWGNLCPPYPHSGGGWWRCRYVYSAKARSIMLADPKEVKALGDPYLQPAHVIENMSTEQLTELAEAQADALRVHSWSADRLADELEQVLRTAHADAGAQPATTVSGSVISDETLKAKIQATVLTNRLQEARDRAAEDARASMHRTVDFDTSEEESQPVHREYARREERRFDTTHLRSNRNGKRVHRDYAAHFFKWGFINRHVEKGDRLLDVGCGVEQPLPQVLTLAPRFVPDEYVGVDLNKIKDPFTSAWAMTHDEFNFVDRYRELPAGHFNKVACVEVIEHMGKEDGRALLEGIWHCLAPGGTLFLSTPVFNGKAAVNHVHEYAIEELQELVLSLGWSVTARFGTFASYRELAKVLSDDHLTLLNRLRAFYSDEVTSCFLAPLYPNVSRNNMWVLYKPEETE